MSANTTRKSHQFWIYHFHRLNHTVVICGTGGGRVKGCELTGSLSRHRNFNNLIRFFIAASVKPKVSQCTTNLDIGFVMDSSASIKSKYSKEKSFVKSLAKTLGVGEKNGNRAGVVTFSTHADYSVKLNG